MVTEAVWKEKGMEKARLSPFHIAVLLDLKI